MPELSKEELAEEIMDILELSLDSLSRMNKGDLKQLYQRLQTLKVEPKGLLDKPLEEILNQEIGGKRVKDMSLGELAKTVREEGPLGLGIVPEIRRVWRNEIRPEIRRLVRGKKRGQNSAAL